MHHWNREDTVNFILDIERTSNVDSFEIQGIKIWPWVRIKLFFYLMDKMERQNPVVVPASGKKRNIFSQMMTSLESWIRLITLGKRPFLFVASDSHRATLDSVSYNKFFDPIRRSLLGESDSALIQYSPSTNKKSFQTSNEISLLSLNYVLWPLWRILNATHRKSVKAVMTKLGLIIQGNLNERGVNVDLLPFLSKNLVNAWLRVIFYTKVWRIVLFWLRPVKIFTLYYYNDHVFSLNIIAAKKNLTTFEMQHGPINAWHMAYGSFSKLAVSQSSQVLPGAFLVWDKPSKITLQESFLTKQIIEVGHPWLDFLESFPQQINKSKKVITYAMQPMAEVGDVFPPFLIRWIRESSTDYHWWFRLHPRQMHELPLIQKKANSLFTDGSFEIELATSTPLPVILKNTDILITSFSGVVTEAAFLGVPSIAFHPNAKQYFPYEYESRLAYLTQEEDHSQSWELVQTKFENYTIRGLMSRENSIEKFQDIMTE